MTKRHPVAEPPPHQAQRSARPTTSSNQKGKNRLRLAAAAALTLFLIPAQPLSADAAVPSDVTEFWLIDAETDTRIRQLSDYDTLRLPLLPDEISIEAVAGNDADSVVMRIDGVVSATENNAPYALGSDISGDFFPVPELRVPGWVDISAQPFDGPNGTGDAGTETEIHLYLDQPDFVVDNPADIGDYDPGDGWCSVGRPPFVADDFAVVPQSKLPEWELTRLKTTLPNAGDPSSRTVGMQTIVESSSSRDAARSDAGFQHRLAELTLNAPVVIDPVLAPISDDQSKSSKSARSGDGSAKAARDLAGPDRTMESTPPFEPVIDDFVRPDWVRDEACTLRAAIEEANALNGRQRIIIDSEKGPFNLTEGQLNVTDGVDIIGYGPRAVIDAGKRSRVFYVTGDHLFNMHRLEVANGRTSSTGRGGGLSIDNEAFVQMSDSVVRGSQANFGGGIALQVDSHLVLTGSALRNNTAGTPEDGIDGGGQTQRGGAIFNNRSNVTVRRSSIVNNTAVRGGGISNYGGLVRVEDSSIIDNEALSIGGGIENKDNLGETGVLHVSFTTVAHNEAGTSGAPPAHERVGGGIYNEATAFMASSILANNTDAYSAGDPLHAPDCYSPEEYGFKSHSNNLVGVISDTCEFAGGLLSGTENAPLNPGLTGSFWDDHRQYRNLLVSSPAIDAGGSAAALYPCGDLDGRDDPRPVGAGCDIGAIERQ